MRKITLTREQKEKIAKMAKIGLSVDEIIKRLNINIDEISKNLKVPYKVAYFRLQERIELAIKENLIGEVINYNKGKRCYQKLEVKKAISEFDFLIYTSTNGSLTFNDNPILYILMILNDRNYGLRPRQITSYLRRAGYDHQNVRCYINELRRREMITYNEDTKRYIASDKGKEFLEKIKTIASLNHSNF